MSDNNTPTGTLANAPKGSRFKFVNKNASNGKDVWVTFTHVAGSDAATLQAEVTHLTVATARDSAAAVATAVGVVKEGTVYRVAKEQLASEFYELAWGKDAGTLVVPFKFQLSDNRLSAGGTLGAYLGFNVGSVTPLLSAGLAVVSAAPPTVGTNATPQPADTKVGFTLATGVVVDWLDPVEIGLIGGADLGMDRATYAYANKIWLSVSIGTGFTRR
jgi:hypothetical protein